MSQEQIKNNIRPKMGVILIKNTQPEVEFAGLLASPLKPGAHERYLLIVRQSSIVQLALRTSRVRATLKGFWHE